MAEHILLVEDERELAELTQDYLQSYGYRVTWVGDGPGAIQAILETQPDLVLLDIMLPGCDGLTVCQQVRPQYSGAIVMFTARDSQFDEIIGLEIGADDFISKSAETRLIAARIKAILRRQNGLPSRSSKPALRFGQLCIDQGAREVRVAEQVVPMTSPEFETLLMLVNHSGEILSKEHLYSSLRGIDYDGYNRMINMIIYSLRKKLGPESKRIKTIRNRGYLFAISEAESA